MSPFGLRSKPEVKRRVRQYCVELIRTNQVYNLLSRKDVQNVVRKHVAASLGILLVRQAGDGDEWVDVGSGAGLPGLVLKIWCPAQQIVLIDGSRRKCVFLEKVSRMLELWPLEILSLRVETLVARREMIGRFGVMLARSVADLPTVLRSFGPLLRAGGCLLTFKGEAWRDEVSRSAGAGLLVPGRYRLEGVTMIPWTTGRILQIRKESA